MASITPTVTDKAAKTKVAFWEQINEDDEGASVRVPEAFSDKVVHFVGTFNGGALTLECSPDDTNWISAKDGDGTAITATAVGNWWVSSNAPYWRVANDNNGSSEDVDVYLVSVAS